MSSRIVSLQSIYKDFFLHYYSLLFNMSSRLLLLLLENLDLEFSGILGGDKIVRFLRQ